MKNNDAQLIQRVLSGDDTAFSVLVKKYQKSVHALVWRKIGDFHIAEDITQDTFLQAYQKLSTLKKPQRFASWLYVIAANYCKMWLRKKRLSTQALEDTSSAELEKVTYSGYVIEENERTTAEAQREVVKKLLAKLQESDRTVITLYYLGGMNYEEISEFVGVSVGAVKSRLHRARQRLKKEEPMIREALGNFQITPNLTENIMHEISRLKPIAPPNGKPFVPWAIGVSTLAVVLLMLGVGNQYLARFQKPYSFDATSEMTVELMDAPVVLNLESKPDVRTQLGNVDAPSKGNQVSHQQPNEVAEAESEAMDMDYSQFELPKAAKARFGKGGINAIQFSPDGTQLAVGTDIGVWLYDMETDKEKFLFRGMCQSLAFSPDGRFLANGGGKFFGQELQLWEIAADRKVPLSGGPFVGSVLQFSEDSKTLVSLGNQGDTIGWLDVETGQGYVKEVEVISGLRIPYPKVFALTQDKIAIGYGDGKIQLWDPKTGKALLTLDEHATPVDMSDDPHVFARMREGPQILALAFSPDGTRLASASKDKTVRLWNINSHESMTLQKHNGWPNVLAFSPNGKVLASGSIDKTVQLWDTTKGEPLATLTGHINGMTALAFSPDSTTLASASADGIIRFWRTETGVPLPSHITGHTSSVRAATFFEDRRGEVTSPLVSVAFNGEIAFWNLETPQKSAVHTAGHQDWLATLAFSPDGTKLASVRAFGNVIFRPGFNDAVWRAGSSLRLTDVRTGSELATLTDIKTPSHLTFSSDGKTVAFSSEAKKIYLWHTETGDELNIPLVDPEAHLTALGLSPDGTTLASGTNQGGIQTWNVATGKALAVFAKPTDQGSLEYSSEHILALCFSSDGTLLAAGSYKLIRIWEVATGNILLSVNPDEHKRGSPWTYRIHPESLVFSPDGAILVSGLVHGAIEVWEVTTGDRIATLDGHTQQVETLAFSYDGKTLVSTGADGTILLWDWNEVLTGSSKSE